MADDSIPIVEDNIHTMLWRQSCNRRVVGRVNEDLKELNTSDGKCDDGVNGVDD